VGGGELRKVPDRDRGAGAGGLVKRALHLRQEIVRVPEVDRLDDTFAAEMFGDAARGATFVDRIAREADREGGDPRRSLPRHRGRHRRRIDSAREE
jgi:hypothetical protein